MSKYLVETFYTCTFKIVHKLNELNEKNLSDLENRKDGAVEIIDVKLNNRKTKTTDKKDKLNTSANDENQRINVKKITLLKEVMISPIDQLKFQILST